VAKPDFKVVLVSHLQMLGFQSSRRQAANLITCMQLIQGHLEPMHSGHLKIGELESGKGLTCTFRLCKQVIAKLREIQNSFVLKEDVTEEYLLANAVRGTLYPQIPNEQSPLLDSIISTTFCCNFNDWISLSIRKEAALTQAIRKAADSMNLTTSNQIELKAK